jgi:hypothetical protein
MTQLLPRHCTEIGAVLESKGKNVNAMECYKETLRLAVAAEAQ